MVCLFFGLPRCGKTTLLARYAVRACSGKRLFFASNGLFGKKYEKVFSNVPLNVDFDNFYYFKNEQLGFYDMSNSLILIDEGTLAFGNRDWKTFGRLSVRRVRRFSRIENRGEKVS